jgi:hypothetical protein
MLKHLILSELPLNYFFKGEPYRRFFIAVDNIVIDVDFYQMENSPIIIVHVRVFNKSS